MSARYPGCGCPSDANRGARCTRDIIRCNERLQYRRPVLGAWAPSRIMLTEREAEVYWLVRRWGSISLTGWGTWKSDKGYIGGACKVVRALQRYGLLSAGDHAVVAVEPVDAQRGGAE